jgi:hypothetical protein
VKRIPISAAANIAKTYGYDQVIVLARKCGESPLPHGEHITTYGVNKAHCGAAATISKKLQQIMGWKS